MKYSKIAMASFLAAVFSMQVLFTGCTKEPAKLEIDRARNTKPKVVEEDGEDAEIPRVQNNSKSQF